MKRYSNKLLVTIAFLLVGFYLHAADDDQPINPILTAIPSLTIAPDARGAGMGDIGAATFPDVYSQHWNPSKYAFHPSKAGIGVSYTPWLSKLVDDIALIYVSGFYKFGAEDNQAISGSVRYFKIGGVPMVDEWGAMNGSVNPYEMAIDLGYSRKLSESFSGSVVMRYMRADYPTLDDTSDSKPGNAFAADISGYNESYLMVGDVECLLGLGFNISNVGSKISLSNSSPSYFIPTNLRLGGSLTYPMDDFNTIAFNLDFSKLLVPSSPIPNVKNGETYDSPEFLKRKKEYEEMSPITGIFKSFGDAPGGFKEELQEISISLGAEYTYNDQFSIRGGYFHENKFKGNRPYFAFGAGLRLSSFLIDASYLVSTNASNPLDKTLRFSIGFDMDGLRTLFK